MPGSEYVLFLAAGHVRVARASRLSGFWRKGWGILGLRVLPPGEGVWLPGAESVHTCFVRFPLDIIFLDKDYRTLAAYHSVPPWRLWVAARGACHVLELGAGTLALLPEIAIGDLWELCNE